MSLRPLTFFLEKHFATYIKALEGDLIFFISASRSLVTDSYLLYFIYSLNSVDYTTFMFSEFGLEGLYKIHNNSFYIVKYDTLPH